MVEANCPPASSRKLRTASGPDRNAAVTRRVAAVLTLPPRVRTYVARMPKCLPRIAGTLLSNESSPFRKPALNSARTAISEGAVRSRLRMFLFGSRVSEDSTGRAPMSPDPPLEVEELGEIDMVSRALATLDLVTHEDARPAFPAVYLEGNTVLSYGELAELVGESERVLRHDRKALVLCAGDRDLSTLLAYLAALRLGHAVAFLPASDEIVSAYQPEFVVPAPGAGKGLADLGYRPAADPIAATTVFQRGEQQRHAGEIYPEMALLLGTSGSTGSPKAVRLSYSGLAGNTAAVIRALGITAAERAPTTLPVTHAYGLSVLNTHLLAGAGVVLGDRSPLSLATWDHLIRSGATSFAAVPTTYAAFGPAHVNLLGRSKIRTMTQSGARLGDDLTMRLVEMMDRRDG